MFERLRALKRTIRRWALYDGETGAYFRQEREPDYQCQWVSQTWE